MKKREFKKQIALYKPNELLSKHMTNEIFLTDKQLDKVIEMKKGTPAEGHGGVIFKYGNRKSI